MLQQFQFEDDRMDRDTDVGACNLENGCSPDIGTDLPRNTHDLVTADFFFGNAHDGNYT